LSYLIKNGNFPSWGLEFITLLLLFFYKKLNGINLIAGVVDFTNGLNFEGARHKL